MQAVYDVDRHSAANTETDTNPTETAAVDAARMRAYYKNAANLQKGLVLGILGLEMVMLTQLLTLTTVPGLLQWALLSFAVSMPFCAMGGVYRTIQSMTGEAFANGFFRITEALGVVVGVFGLIVVFFHLYPLAGMVFAVTSVCCTVLTYYLFWKFRPESLDTTDAIDA